MNPRPARALLLAALATALGPAALRAQDHAVEGPVIVVPQSASPIPGHARRARPVELTAVDAKVTLLDGVATTTLTLTLKNPGAAPREAQVLLPVPDGAAIRGLTLEGSGQELVGKILPRDEARRIYDEIVAKTRDPALLEFTGLGVVRSSVFPVPPGGEQHVRITYEHVPPAEATGDSTRIDYVLPRSDAAGAATAWTFAMDVRSTRKLAAVYSPSHEVTVSSPDADPTRARLALTAAGASSPGPVRVSVLATRPDGWGVTTFLCADPDGGQGGYFMLLATPPRAGDAPRPARPREVTIVLDRSGSMRGEKMDQAREAARQVIEALKPGERFNVIDYSDAVASLAPAPVAKDEATLRTARAYLTDLTAGGGTNIHAALQQALGQPRPNDALPVILFLTDGLPTVGQTAESAIRALATTANPAERRLFTFGVGLDVNAPLLTGLAKDARGSSTFVLPQEDVEAKVGQVFRRLTGPVLTAPTLTSAQGAVADLAPANLPDVFEGEQIIVLGRYRQTPAALTLTGTGPSGPESITIEPAGAASASHAFVPRLWAQRRIAALIEQVRLAGGAERPVTDPKSDPRTKELVDEVVRLSTRWGILTEYTAFLAAEPEQTRRMTDAMNALPASVPPAARYERAAAEVVAESLRSRAVEARSGAAGVNQDMNLKAMQSAAAPAAAAEQTYVDARLQRVDLKNAVQQFGRRTLYQRQGRLVDAALLAREHDAPDLTLTPRSPEHRALVTELAARGEAGLLAAGQDVLIQHNGRRILLRTAD